MENYVKYLFQELHQTQGEPSSAHTKGFFYQQDSLEGLPFLLNEWEERFQLIYLDPPFFTGQSFIFQQRVGEAGWRGDNGSIISQIAYSDKWEGGKESFLTMLRQILSAVYRLLRPDGCLYLHLDYRTSPYARIILDEIFGEDNFLNEIIWHYKSGGRAKRFYSRKHDTLLFYRKSKNHYFNIEAVGEQRGTTKRNNMKRQLDDTGRVYYSIRSGGKEYRYYEDSKIYPTDVWDDISHLQQKDPERTGYDTQKPEGLLSRIILSSSRPGDWVGDFFAGSGTTLAVAQKTGRNWVGMDAGVFSLHTCRKRLLNIPSNSDLCFIYPKDNHLNSGDNSVFRMGYDEEGKGYIHLLQYPYCENIVINNVKDSLDYIDYWAVGSISEDTFTPRAYSMRQLNHPMLDHQLSFPLGHKEPIAVHIIDVAGKQSYFVLPEGFQSGDEMG